MVTNRDVVATLERIADLLEIKGGDNAFRARAYRQAAVQVENLSTPLADLAAQGVERLRTIAGFGPAIAAKVHELVTTGRLGYLEELEAEVPPSLLELRSLPGVGPRTAALLWTEAGVTSLDDLAEALESGRLAGLPRMGERTLQNLRAAIARRRQEGKASRRPRAEVEPVAAELLAALRAHPAVERAEIAGSFRRGRPDVGDLDIVVATREPEAVLRAFASLPQVERVLLRGDTKCSVAVAGGLQVDCRAVAPEQFGAALQYFTGSAAHNVRLRGLAQRLGMTLNEYGLFRLDDGALVAGATEEEVYAALGLRWIPPEEREDHGEIEAARLDAPIVAASAATEVVG